MVLGKLSTAHASLIIKTNAQRSGSRAVKRNIWARDRHSESYENYPNSTRKRQATSLREQGSVDEDRPKMLLQNLYVRGQRTQM